MLNKRQKFGEKGEAIAVGQLKKEAEAPSGP
jgi:hypothetical protein